MPTARKLPSGSWRCLVFSHNEPIFDKKGRQSLIQKQESRKKSAFMSHSPATIQAEPENALQKQWPPSLQQHGKKETCLHHISPLARHLTDT